MSPKDPKLLGLLFSDQISIKSKRIGQAWQVAVSILWNVFQLEVKLFRRGSFYKISITYLFICLFFRLVSVEDYFLVKLIHRFSRFLKSRGTILFTTALDVSCFGIVRVAPILPRFSTILWYLWPAFEMFSCISHFTKIVLFLATIQISNGFRKKQKDKS